MTNILALPEMGSDVTIQTGEDWREAPFAFTDPASGAPIPLDGILLHLQVRLSASDNEIYLEGSTDDGSLQIVSSSAIVAVASSGTGYAVNDLIHASSSGAIVPMTIKVAAIGGSGAVTAAVISDPGIYADVPTNPVAQGSTSGSGTGATFNLTWVNNALEIAFPAASLPAKFVAGDYAYGIQAVADGYTQDLCSGALKLVQGVVR